MVQSTHAPLHMHRLKGGSRCWCIMSDLPDLFTALQKGNPIPFHHLSQSHVLSHVLPYFSPQHQLLERKYNYIKCKVTGIKQMLCGDLAVCVPVLACWCANGIYAQKLLKDLFTNYTSALRPVEDTNNILNVTLQVTLSQIIDMVKHHSGHKSNWRDNNWSVDWLVSPQNQKNHFSHI